MRSCRSRAETPPRLQMPPPSPHGNKARQVPLASFDRGGKGGQGGPGAAVQAWSQEAEKAKTGVRGLLTQREPAGEGTQGNWCSPVRQGAPQGQGQGLILHPTPLDQAGLTQNGPRPCLERILGPAAGRPQPRAQREQVERQQPCPGQGLLLRLGKRQQGSCRSGHRTGKL